jgi:hypothetical protein
MSGTLVAPSARWAMRFNGPACRVVPQSGTVVRVIECAVKVPTSDVESPGIGRVRRVALPATQGACYARRALFRRSQPMALGVSDAKRHRFSPTW